MRISLCTTCMDRLFHLRQVFKKNLISASSFADVEFVLLNYGSGDGLDEWVKENLSQEIENGRVSYYRTYEPEYWVAAHAKNVAHKLASGEILCNIDSDILIPEGFCEYLSSIFESKPDTIVAFDSDDIYGNHGCAGIVASMKGHFHSVNGYDESLSEGWCCDDTNFQFRCRMKNSLDLFVPPKLCLCIPHSNEVRTQKCRSKEIEETRKASVTACEKSALEKDYVANKSGAWGRAKVFKNFSDAPIKT